MASSMTHHRNVVGVFPDHREAEQVANDLVRAGFRRDQIDIRSQSAAQDAIRTTDRDDDEGIAGFFRRIFGRDDEYDQYRYTNAVQQGRAVVTVSTDEAGEDRAVEILNAHNAIDIDHEAPAPPSEKRVATRTDTRARDEVHENHTIPVVREELQVGKRLVQRGGVRIVNSVTEQPVSEEIRLREEHVNVERRPADRPATEHDLKAGEEVIEITEMAEEPVVGKRTRVVEEVVVDKDVTERTETIHDTVKRKDVDVQPLGATDQSLAANLDADFRRDFDTRYSRNRNARWETYEPAYRYGSEMASAPQYRNRRWDDVEPALRSDYDRRYRDSAWQEIKDAVRYGWDKVTGRR